jgi:hypothetical protein
MNEDITQGERSLLFYVLDCIERAPAKYDTLCARCKDEMYHTTEFLDYIDRLASAKTPEEAVKLAKNVRAEIL